jgi:hypothetical protein
MADTSTDTSTTEQARAAASSAVDESRDVAQTAKQAAGSVAEEARQQAGNVARDVRDQARNLMGETRTQLRDSADAQTRSVASSLQGFADQLRALASGRPDEAGGARRYVDMASDAIGDLAGLLQSRNFEGVVRDVQQFARRRPGVFLAAAAGAGFVAGRLVRNSAAAETSITSPGYGSSGQALQPSQSAPPSRESPPVEQP